jgi:hypothetical protein
MATTCLSGQARECCAGYDIRVVDADARSCAASFGAGAFDVVMDKSTVDAMLCDAARVRDTGA